MRAAFTTIVCLLAATTSVRAQEVKHLSLDEASSVRPLIESDPQVKVEGTGSLRITTVWPTSITLGEVTGLEVENANLEYSAQVKTELDGSGTAFLEMWVRVDGGQYFSRGMNDPVGPISDWKTVRTPFMFQGGQNPDKVTLNLVINGTGTVWVDDVVLTKKASN